MRSRPRSWLFQIARHDLYDYRRKQQRPGIEPAEERVPDGLHRLSPRELPRPARGPGAADGRRADRPQVAAILGKTTGAVKALQHRGLARLARLLVSRGGDPS